MIHRFDFKADLHKVYDRLAGKENAGVAESLGTPLVTETTQVEPLSPAPQVKGEH